MNKFDKVFRKSIVENYYRLLSLADVTVNKAVVPITQKAFNYVQDQVNSQLKLIGEKQSPELFNLLEGHIQEGMKIGHKLTMTPLESLGERLNDSVLYVEEKLRDEYGIDTNQWLFSKENLDIMEKISDLGVLTFQELQHIDKYDAIRYLTAWTILQRFYWTHYEKKMAMNKNPLDYTIDREKYKEFKEIQKECYIYSLFANGAYGSLSSYLFSELKGISRPEKYTDNTQEFISHTKIPESDVLYSFWDATPYKPAYVIASHHKEKAIILSIRGTNHWADAVTDLDFHYLSFSIMREANSDRMFLKFNYNPETQEYLRKRLGNDTRELNGEVSQPLTGNEVVVETGYAHAGMLVSAIGAYKEITSKLECTLSRLEYDEYQLRITGHSLGGGMATLAVLLYTVHPLKAIKGQVNKRLRGFSYGGASVLSLDFDKYMQGVMNTVVLGYDIVPRLTYGSIRDLCKVILVFDEIKKKDPEIISQVLWLEVSGGDLNKLQNEERSHTTKLIELYEHFKQKHMDSLKLFPMGKVFHVQDFRTEPIKRNGKTFEFVMREINQKEFFDEISFSRNVIKHHFADAYEGCLLSDKILYQKYLDKPINYKEGYAKSRNEIKHYTE